CWPAPASPTTRRPRPPNDRTSRSVTPSRRSASSKRASSSSNGSWPSACRTSAVRASRARPARPPARAASAWTCGSTPSTSANRAADDPADLPAPVDCGDDLLALLAHPSVADHSWVYRQYDHQLFLNTVIAPGADAAVLRLKAPGVPNADGSKGIALATDGNG